MIYYFSGTGNSRYAAEFLAKRLGEDTVLIPYADPSDQMPDGNSIGFVFPVYSWGIPPLVADFIGRLPESFINKIKSEGMPVWSVMTCGDETALAPEMFVNALDEVGLKAESIWSVIMPNNYVLLPGFDTDARKLETKKLAECKSRLEEIANGISQHFKGIDVTRGGLPWMKSRLVYPLFKKWGIFPRRWVATDACVGCGICASACPLGNIRMNDGRPVWGDDCSSCLACYHSCPRHAVEYGGATKGKGQYVNPLLPPYRREGR